MYQVSLTLLPTITHTHTIPGEDAAGKRTRQLSGGGARCLTDRTAKEVSESQSINRAPSSLHKRELPNPAQPAPLYTRTHTHTPRVRSRSLSPSKLCPVSPSDCFSSFDAHCPSIYPDGNVDFTHPHTDGHTHSIRAPSLSCLRKGRGRGWRLQLSHAWRTGRLLYLSEVCVDTSKCVC